MHEIFNSLWSLVIFYFLALLVLTKAVKDGRNFRMKRGYFQSTYPLTEDLQIGGVNVNSYGRGKVLSTPSQNGLQNNPHFVELSPLIYQDSNAIDKPVNENQDDVPPESFGTAILPEMPPPAIPVNAVAANVPTVGNAAFLGAGGLGVLDLGGGAYALGSGSIGYSERRSNPRQSLKAPFLPAIQASPNLLPAAVRSPNPPTSMQSSYPGAHPPIDQNGYEFLTPERVTFGSPRPPRPHRVTQNFAIPSPLQIEPQFPQQPSLQQFSPQQQRQAPQSFQTQQQQQQQQLQQFAQQHQFPQFQAQQQLQQQQQQEQQFQQQQQQEQQFQQQQQEQQSPQEAIFGQRLSNVFASTHLLR